MNRQIDQHLGLILRKRRRTLGLTQKDVALAVGVRFQQIQKYECGADRIYANRLWSLARVLKLPIDAFFQDLEGSPSLTAHMGGAE